MKRLRNWLRPPSRKRTLRVPPGGRALVVSDLHGNWADWVAVRERTRVFERIAAGEDLWLFITGDVPDVTRHQSVDPDVPDDGDTRILDDLLAARAELGERAERIVYLEGNHDFHVARICREVLRLHRRDVAREDGAPAVTPAEYAAYCEHYRATYGEAIFENNVSPYDMVPRARAGHLRFLADCPVLAVLEGSGVVITHAGPPRMDGHSAKSLQRALDAADLDSLRTASPEQYYASPYHQLLNNRFRNGNYGLADLERFLAVFEANLLVTGHTPHPYLVDFDRRAPFRDCSFTDGLGWIGGRQAVLCSSFGAFQPSLKRYLELDMTRRFADSAALHEAGAPRPLYPEEATTPAGPSLPGLEFSGLNPDEV